MRFTFLLAAALTAAASPVSARELHHRVTLAAGGDSWLRDPIGFHGFATAVYDLNKLPAGAHFGLEWNTTRVRVSFDRIKLAKGRLETGLHAEGELGIAALLTDYFRRGRLDGQRAFNASYVAFGAYLKGNLPKHNYLELFLGGRRWFFQRGTNTYDGERTHDAFVMPPDAWVVETRLRYTFWKIRDDPSIRQRHRPFYRVHGIAIGIDIGVDWRSQRRPWGALDPAVFDPIDPRNDPGKGIVMIRQWLRAGRQLSKRVRTQVFEYIAWGHGEDDLTRARVGGMNPYHLPLAGTAWGSFVSDRLFSLQWSWHFKVWKELEVGALADLLVVADPDRIGRNGRSAFQAGVGLLMDFRYKAWQVDFRMGWSPTMPNPGPAGHWNLYLGLGWTWEKTTGAPKKK